MCSPSPPRIWAQPRVSSVEPWPNRQYGVLSACPDRDGFGRRRFQQQCETILPHDVARSLVRSSIVDLLLIFC